jgi:hypothetical protein
MPVILTFDLEQASQAEHNRLQSLFQRLGWEDLGGSSYRYPRLGTKEKVEDWFNHVVPALMLFRNYLLKSKRKLTGYTLDVQSSAGYNPSRKFGKPPLASAKVSLYIPTRKTFGVKKLKAWLADDRFPY